MASNYETHSISEKRRARLEEFGDVFFKRLLRSEKKYQAELDQLVAEGVTRKTLKAACEARNISTELTGIYFLAIEGAEMLECIMATIKKNLHNKTKLHRMRELFLEGLIVDLTLEVPKEE